MSSILLLWLYMKLFNHLFSFRDPLFHQHFGCQNTENLMYHHIETTVVMPVLNYVDLVVLYNFFVICSFAMNDSKIFLENALKIIY